jgi:hypothetical protein
MDSNRKPPLPMSLTLQELEAFNSFWTKLSPPDREEMAHLFQNTWQNEAGGVDQTFNYLSYPNFLLSVLLEEHQEVKRLRRQLEEHLNRVKFHSRDV